MNPYNGGWRLFVAPSDRSFSPSFLNACDEGVMLAPSIPLPCGLPCTLEPLDHDLLRDAEGDRLRQDYAVLSELDHLCQVCAALRELDPFTSSNLAPDTDLVQFGARCYDPLPGRWLSNDPLGCTAADAHLYRYPADAPLPAEEGGGS